jgi:hypothetical protein
MTNLNPYDGYAYQGAYIDPFGYYVMPPSYDRYYDAHTGTWLPAARSLQDTTDYQDALRHAEVQNAIADAIVLLNEALQKLRNQG